MSFYNSNKWKHKRKRILKRDLFLCQECKRYGNDVTANIVHHIFPLEDYPELRLNSSNLISVCGDCHNSYHDRKTNKLTQKGIELLERKKNKILN